MKVINVARDFSDTPGGRFTKLGPKSGEEFRTQLLDLLKNGHDVEVILDGTEGYGSSFLEEAFGGLVRVEGGARLIKRVKVVAKTAEYKMYEVLANQYIDDALHRISSKAP